MVDFSLGLQVREAGRLVVRLGGRMPECRSFFHLPVVLDACRSAARERHSGIHASEPHYEPARFTRILVGHLS